MSNFFCCFPIFFNSFCMNRFILISICRIMVILLYSFRLINGRRKISLSNFCMSNLLLIRNDNFLPWILLNNWFSSFLLNLMMRWNVIAVLNLPSIWRNFSLKNSLPRNNNSLPLWKNLLILKNWLLLNDSFSYRLRNSISSWSNSLRRGNLMICYWS